MNFTKKDLDEAIKVDEPKNTANPFADFIAVLPKGFKTNTLYKINDKNFLYVPDDKRFKEIKSIHLLRQLGSDVLVSAVACNDITITRERLSNKTVFIDLRK